MKFFVLSYRIRHLALLARQTVLQDKTQHLIKGKTMSDIKQTNLNITDFRDHRLQLLLIGTTTTDLKKATAIFAKTFAITSKRTARLDLFYGNQKK